MTVETGMSIVAAVAVLALVALSTVVVVRTRRKEGEDPLTRLVGELQTSLAGRDGALDAKVSQIDTKLASLQETVTGRQAVLDEQVRGIGGQMETISTLFRNDRARGGWGEISMMRIFELGGLVEGRDFTAHFQSADGIPDAVVHLPGGGSIVIDCKFPVVRYNEALATEDPVERGRLLAEHGKEIERVGKSLVGRGYPSLSSGDYVVLYLPSQAVFEAAAAAHPEVIDRLLQQKVVIAGPTALFALMMNVASLVTQHRALQQADRILDEAKELQSRMKVFVSHLQAVGGSLARTVATFNALVGSWTSRVAPQLTRVGELSGHDEHPGIDPIDEAVREIASGAHAFSGTSVQN